MRTVSFLFRSCRRLAALSFLGFLLTACGGGGGVNPPGGTNPPGGNNPPDTTPDTFTLTPLTGVAPDLLYVSDTTTVTGINTTATIGIAGTDCTYTIGDGSATAAAGTVSNGQAVRVQIRATNAYDTARACTLTIGGVEADFTVTTGKNGFAFEIQPGTLRLEWSSFSGVTRYELTRHNAETGESVFVSDDIAADATEHATALGVHLTDWVNDRFTLSACNESGCVTLPAHDVVLGQALSARAITYAKASNTDSDDRFGYSVALDGDTLAVGAISEDSGVDDDQADNSASSSGAVYVFHRTDGAWSQAAYLKASNTEAGDEFGFSIALDGDTLAVGAHREDSLVPGDQDNNSAGDSGAVYVFQRTDGAWNQTAYLKASNTGAGDQFGYSIALDGDTLAVGARYEASANGNPADNTAHFSGAAYVFQRANDIWSQSAYLKASNIDGADRFGSSIAVSGDTLVVGAPMEDSSAIGVNGDSDDNSAGDSGAVYVFHRTDGAWSQTTYLKASNTGVGDEFGFSIALDRDTLAIGTPREDSAAAGADGNQDDNSGSNNGAVYVFHRTGDTWAQAAYLKASNSGANSLFGHSVMLNGDTLAIGAPLEDSAAIGVDGDEANNNSNNSGAVYVFQRVHDNWAQTAYLKASNTGAGDRFGHSIALDTNTLSVGANNEDTAATGVDGEQTDDCDSADTANCANDSGAIYIF